jgi:hypothetical protein
MQMWGQGVIESRGYLDFGTPERFPPLASTLFKAKFGRAGHYYF